MKIDPITGINNNKLNMSLECCTGPSCALRQTTTLSARLYVVAATRVETFADASCGRRIDGCNADILFPILLRPISLGKAYSPIGDSSRCSDHNFPAWESMLRPAALFLNISCSRLRQQIAATT